MRLDQGLWAVRVFKSRALAVEAIKSRHVKVNGAETKPAHEAKGGELVTARTGLMTRTLRVLDGPRSRVAAKFVPLYAEDLTPPEELAKRDERSLRTPGFRPKGAGRPTKRERRVMDELGGE